MSTTGILDQLAALQLTISGINGAFPKVADHTIPNRVLEDVELPCFINLMGDERYTRVADDLWEVDISIQAILIVQRAVGGVPGEATAALEPWRDTVVDFFMARPTLDGYTGLMDDDGAGITGSGAPGKVQWGLNIVYLGCDFNFRFIEQRLIVSQE